MGGGAGCEFIWYSRFSSVLLRISCSTVSIGRMEFGCFCSAPIKAGVRGARTTAYSQLSYFSQLFNALSGPPRPWLCKALPSCRENMNLLAPPALLGVGKSGGIPHGPAPAHPTAPVRGGTGTPPPHELLLSGDAAMPWAEDDGSN